jgi:hypothetical protein
MRRKTGLYLAAALLLAACSGGPAAEPEAIPESLQGPVADAPVPPGDPPDLKAFRYRALESAVLAGNSGEATRGWNCTGAIAPQDRLQRLAIVALFYQNGCFGDGRYNNGDYPVERGELSDATGRRRFAAYRVSPPRTHAREFLGSHHALFYRFPTREAYTVYALDGSNLSEVAQVPAAQADPARYVKLAVDVSGLGTPQTYVFAPRRASLSAFTRLGPGVEGARVVQSKVLDVLKYRYEVQGVPFDAGSDFVEGPDSHYNVYGIPQHLFVVRGADGAPGVVWQDQATLALHVSWLGADLRSIRTLPLESGAEQVLAAATHDERGNLYYVTVQRGDGVSEGDRSRTAWLLKAGPDGRTLKKSALDTSAQGLNVVAFSAGRDETNGASLRYAAGRLGLILERRMHRTPDGLNHQGGIAAVFDAETLALQHNWGQTSGHSFENMLTVNGQGQFLAIDLGDNYPRGVHLHVFSEDQRRSAVVYTFKTEHGKKPQSPAGRSYGRYAEISSNGTTFYKWSNDNRTYTELGGVVDGPQGYTVVFAGEPWKGRALDSARVGHYLNDPRNIGLVLVRKDFVNEPGARSEVRREDVLSKGSAERGGFYTFGGTWSPQANAGVVWLTDYREREAGNVSRLKAVDLGKGSILLLWERWTPTAYVSTYAMKVDAAGRRLSEPVELGSHVRLERCGLVALEGGRLLLASGDKASRQLELLVLKVKP